MPIKLKLNRQIDVNIKYTFIVLLYEIFLIFSWKWKGSIMGKKFNLINLNMKFIVDHMVKYMKWECEMWTFHPFKCNHIFIPFFFIPTIVGDIAICHNKRAPIIDHHRRSTWKSKNNNMNQNFFFGGPIYEIFS